MKINRFLTNISYVYNSGYLLSVLSGNPNALEGVTHIIIDEIHERDVDADLLLCILKRSMRGSSKRLILMSATLETEKFTQYFNDAVMIEISGRIFDVEELFLEDIRQTFSILEIDEEENDETRTTVELIRTLHVRKPMSEGILVFQPGLAAIEVIHEKLREKMKSKDFEICIVHSEVNDTNVFEKLPNSVRKIVLATNVAETSITIEDMVSLMTLNLTTSEILIELIFILFLIDTGTRDRLRPRQNHPVRRTGRHQAVGSRLYFKSVSKTT